LTHSSITRFFRGAKKVEINSKGVALGVTAGEAHPHLLETCLTLLCNKQPNQILGRLSDSNNLLKYAANHFLGHLSGLQSSLMTILEKTLIAQYLLQMFRDDETLDRWAESLESVPAWPLMIEVDHIWALVGDENLRQSLSLEEQALITDTKITKAQKILGLLTKIIARK
jgi:hypothetical protein